MVVGRIPSVTVCSAFENASPCIGEASQERLVQGDIKVDSLSCTHYIARQVVNKELPSTHDKHTGAWLDRKKPPHQVQNELNTKIATTQQHGCR